jgi:hypothetical protein
MNDERAGGAPIGDWQLERFCLDELPAEEREAVSRALEHDATLRARLAEMERSDGDILASHPARVMAAAIRARGAAERPASLRPATWIATVGVAVLAILAVAPLWMAHPVADDETRVKGLTTRLLVFRQGAAAPEALPSGSSVRARDVVQLAYQATARRFAVIVSVDGRGVVTRHLPKDSAQAAALTAGTPVPLPEAYELDDAPRFERFHLVAATAPFAVEQVLAAAAAPPAAGDRLDLPPSFEQHTVVLRKEPTR